MNTPLSMRVRVVLEIGSPDNIVGVLDEQESLWAGGDLTNEAALALFTKCRDEIAKADKRATDG